LINLKNTKISFNNLYKKLRFPRKILSIFLSYWSYVECIATCDISYGRCISRYVEIFKKM